MMLRQKNYISNILLFLTILMFIISCLNSESAHEKELPFDSEQWKSGNEHIRGLMYKNLIYREVLIGETKDEVKKLIGSPNKIEKNQFIFFIKNENAVYPVSLLIVEFNEASGVVDSVWATD